MHGSNAKCKLCFSQALEQQAGASDDFQETASGTKELSKKKFSMDAALEDKICDLYDLYVDVLTQAFNFVLEILFLYIADNFIFCCLIPWYIFLGSRGWMKMQVRK